MALRDPLAPHSSSAAELKAFNAAERDAHPFLAWRDAAGALQIQTLDDEGVTMGRAAGSTVHIAWDPRVSSVHAEIRPVATEWVIIDDGLSRNGTFVGAERVVGRRRLRHGDRILVGETLLAFHAGKPTNISTIAGTATVQRADLQANELAVLKALCRPLILNESEEPLSTVGIAGEVYLTQDGVKRCLTRLYRTFGISEDPKRRRLAQQAIRNGVVRRTDYV